MAKASELIKLAQSWVGKNESDGSHKEIIDIYNGHQPLARNYRVRYDDEWCATTITALAIKSDAVDIIPKECSCQYMIELFKKIGCWIENENRTPKPGDIIFYDWQDNGSGDNKGWSDHVGIVEKVVDNVITVIEGNYNCAVKRRTLKVNAKCIRGYGVPKYEEEIVRKNRPIDEWAKDVIAGLHGDGHYNREVSLKKAGCTYAYEDVRKRVNELLSAPEVSPYYPKYKGDSARIDVVLKEIGVPSQYTGNWTKRKPIAQANGVKNYTGTASQNNTLISLAKKGKLKRV